MAEPTPPTDPKLGPKAGLDAKDPMAEYHDIATKLFNEQFVSIQPEEYTQFLAANDEDSSIISGFYMDLFKWDPNLLKATRTLCSKLYLKGESQEIDRILTSFTKSYIKQNPVNVFCTKNFEKIYIVLYSLILLNTSLHNSEINKKSKISQSDYIRNTFTTFVQQDVRGLKKLSIKQRISIERELGGYYDDLLGRELQLKTQTGASQDGRPTSLSGTTTPGKSSSTTTTSPGKGASTTAGTAVAAAAAAAEKSENGELGPENGPTTDDATAAAAAATGGDLTRQLSSSSVWSTDTSRNSLSIKRMPSGTSSVSQFTVNPGHQRQNNRVGFTRALASDQMNQRFYSQGNPSMVSNGTYGTVRNRQSLDRLRSLPQTVNRRSSRASIISRDSLATNQEDSMSVVSFESGDLTNIPIDETQSQQVLENFNVNEFQDKFDLILELQGSPYLKEGILKLKILNNDQQDNNLPDMSTSSSASMTTTSSTSRFFSFFTRSANSGRNPLGPETNSLNPSTTNVLNNKFVEYFVVVSKGELNLYSFDPKVIKKHKDKLRKIKQKQQKQLINSYDLGAGDTDDEVNETSDDLGDGNWLKNAANVGNYNLCSTFAQLEKASNYTKKTNGYVFSLTFPKTTKKPNKQFIFEAGTKEIALEFINSCNFWSAKITAIPTFEESVSSIEYGWTNLDSLISQKPNFKKLKSIYKWESLPQGVYLSNYNDSLETHYNMMKQFIKTLNYYNNLKRHFKEFNELRLKFIKNFSQFSSVANYTKVIGNYDAKLVDYKFELKKYKNYLILLGFGLQLRFDLEEEEKDQTDQADLGLDQGELPPGQDLALELAPGQEAELAPEQPDAVQSGEVDAKTEKVDTKLENDKLEDLEEDDGETELSRLVKYEIRKLFIGLKDVGKIIPTFQTSKSISNLNELQTQIPNLTVNDFNNSFALVKSPKTFTLSNYNDNESPINQLLNSQRSQVGHTFSTNTIKEEDED